MTIGNEVGIDRYSVACISLSIMNPHVNSVSIDKSTMLRSANDEARRKYSIPICFSDTMFSTRVILARAVWKGWLNYAMLSH